MTDRPPLETHEEFLKKAAEWDRAAKLPSGEHKPTRISLMNVIDTDISAVMVSTNGKYEVFHVEGKTDTLIGRLEGSEKGFVFHPEGWQPPQEFRGPHSHLLAREAWTSYFYNVVKKEG